MAAKPKESSSSSSDYSSEEEVSKKATPQPNRVAPIATPKEVTLAKSEEKLKLQKKVWK